MQHLHNAWCAGCTQSAFPQSLEKKSSLIKLRWDTLPELAICDQTNCLNFFLSQVYPFRPSQQTVLKLFQKQWRKCKWAEPHDPENTTKSCEEILKQGCLIFSLSHLKPTERGARPTNVNQESRSSKWFQTYTECVMEDFSNNMLSKNLLWHYLTQFIRKWLSSTQRPRKPDFQSDQVWWSWGDEIDFFVRLEWS